MQVQNERIINIEYIGEMDAMDITVDGNHLFFANDILTHNSNSDISMTDTSESMGLVHTLDLYLAQMAPEDLMEINQMMFKQLKNRYNDPNYYKKFVVGFDRPKMTFYNLEQSAQENISKDASSSKNNKDDKPAFDKSKTGSRMRGDHNFGDFNFGE